MQSLLDASLLCRYKTCMQPLRRWLVGAALPHILASCSLFQGGAPTAPEVTSAPPVPPSPTTAPPPTPTETPVPIMRVSAADKSLFNGDYDAAIQQYGDAVADSQD